MDNLALDERQLGLHALQRSGRHGVEIPIPHGEVGILADLDRADAVLSNNSIEVWEVSG